MISRLGRSVTSILVLVLFGAPLSAVAAKFCSSTAASAFSACQNSARDDLNTALGICTNLSDDAARSACMKDARSERHDADDLCREQLSARRSVCKKLGEARYEPSFDPADFDTDFAHPSHPNPYFPTAIGDRWVYKSGSEVDTVEITEATKLIDGVTCIVSHDVVKDDGDLTEDTNDWFAQAKSGAVFYCGEEAKQYESFDGDEPRVPELVGNEGSFKAGRDGAQTGILFLPTATVGALYRQEFSLGTAEDLAQVLSTTYKFGQDAELDQFVPQALAELLCGAGDCVVTRDFSPLEPDSIERKYYAAGIGDFLEIELDTGVVTQLVECNFDARCGMLPSP